MRMTRGIEVLIALLLLWSSRNNLGQGRPDSVTANLIQAAGAPNATDSMVALRGETFQIGIDASEVPHFEDAFDIHSPQLFQDEVPKHWVSLNDFQIDRYLVTNAQFKEFVDANPAWRPGQVASELDNGNYLKHWKQAAPFATKADHPVVNVNWYAAAAYCKWTGKRLPFEAEWEYAARDDDAALFPWGNQAVDSRRANYSGSGLKTTAPIGSYPPNRHGLFDMAGNVWQFLADEWRPYPAASKNSPVAGQNWSRDETAFPQVKTRRVIRGGSFGGAPVNLWVEYRDSHPPNGSQEFVGFRCAK